MLQFVWSFFKTKKALIAIAPPPKQIQYEDLYNPLPKNIKSGGKPSNDCYILESCPVGNVLFKYNTNKESFEYYSDRNVPFRYLETIARKYVRNTHCIDIYVAEKTKQSCNRYSYLGKLNNFDFLKVPPRKVVAAKCLSFAEFKASTSAAAAAASAASATR